ncbi:MAG: ATP synthase F0 subunit B [Elusimicrobiota bacterium]|jgi:F-type H+-transporting ATPase subunit b|nr:ATP synthase F0 subunit B [Elusimicrobiota bacterium]
MEMLNIFGLKPSLFLFQVINFLIIFLILKKFMIVPLKKIFNERERKIKQSMQDAEEAKIALANAKKEKDRIIHQAQISANVLVADTKLSVEKARESAFQDIKEKTTHILSDAKQKAEMEFQTAQKEIGQMSVELSGKLITKILSDLFSDDEKQKLINRALEKINETRTN